MSQIAQQDHLYITIEDAIAPSTAEQEKLKQCYLNGTLLDVVIITTDAETKIKSWCPILHYYHDVEGNVVDFVIFINGAPQEYELTL